VLRADDSLWRPLGRSLNRMLKVVILARVIDTLVLGASEDALLKSSDGGMISFFNRASSNVCPGSDSLAVTIKEARGQLNMLPQRMDYRS